MAIKKLIKFIIKIFILQFIILFFVAFSPQVALAVISGLDRTAITPQSQQTRDAGVPFVGNPFDKLQIKIPGLARFTDAAPCPDDSSKYCVRWIGEYIVGIYKYAISIVGILATVVMMFGGVIWLTAGGNPQRIGEAKSWITASLTGLIIALSSYLILYQVNPGLVGFGPLAIPKVDILASEAIAAFTAGDGSAGTGNITADKRDYNALLANAALANAVDGFLLKATMFAESGGNPNVQSSMGAIGLMQLMPGTAQTIGFNPASLTDPATNISAGAAYVARLKTTACNGQAANEVCDANNIRYLIAAYNGGPKANTPSKTCPNKTYWECEANFGYAETRSYVQKVQANIQTLQNNNWGVQ